MHCFSRSGRSIRMWKRLAAFAAINMARRRSRRLQSLATFHAENCVAHHLRAALGASYHARFTQFAEQLRVAAQTEFRLVVIRRNIIRYSSAAHPIRKTVFLHDDTMTVPCF